MKPGSKRARAPKLPTSPQPPALANQSSLEEQISSIRPTSPSLERLAQCFITLIEDVNQNSTRGKVKQPKNAQTAKKKKFTDKKLPMNRFKLPQEELTSGPQVTTSNYRPPIIEVPSPADQYFADQLVEYNQINWDIPTLVSHLQLCYANNLLNSTQIDYLNEWVAQNIQAGPFSDQKQLVPQAAESQLERDSHPLNCMHIRICYFIWDKQSHKGGDPTEIGRQYKKEYFDVF